MFKWKNFHVLISWMLIMGDNYTGFLVRPFISPDTGHPHHPQDYIRVTHLPHRTSIPISQRVGGTCHVFSCLSEPPEQNGQFETVICSRIVCRYYPVFWTYWDPPLPLAVGTELCTFLRQQTTNRQLSN